MLKAHYISLEGNQADAEYIQVQSPSVAKFELFIVSWAIRLLEHIVQTQLMSRSSLEQDIALLERVTPADWNSYTIIKLNVVSKTIYHKHLKTMKVLQKILDKIVSL